MDWQNLPTELYYKVFSYLGRRDRLACILTCQKWRTSMDYVGLWSKMVVYVDQDFMEPSTIFLIRDFSKYLKYLEIGWEKPIINQSKWSLIRFKNLTKRVGRFLLLLEENLVQLKTLKIFEWYEIYQLRKLSYLLTRFLKLQANLEHLVLINANLHKLDFSNIILSCIATKDVLKSIQVHNNTYIDISNCSPNLFVIFLENCVNISVLKVDYLIFYTFIHQLCATLNNLKTIEVWIDENEFYLPNIRADKWWDLITFCPNAQIDFAIGKAVATHFLVNLLKWNIPLKSLSLQKNIVFTGFIADIPDYKKFGSVLAYHYCNSLENLDLTVDFEELVEETKEDIVGVLKYLMIKCKKLKSVRLNQVELFSKATKLTCLKRMMLSRKE